MPAYSLFFRAKSKGGFFNFQSRFTNGYLASDDASANDPQKLNRNESHRTTLYQLSVGAELNLLKDKEMISRLKRPILPYLHGGIALMYFNPRIHGAKYGLEDKMYNTYHAQTERQSTDEKLYSRWTMTVPFGFGLKFNVSHKWTIQYQFDMTYAFTDYLDNTSTTYGNPAVMIDDGTIGSMIWSNRLDGSLPDPGTIKGNPEVNDWFMYNSVTVIYRFDMYEMYRSSFYQNLAFWLNKPGKRS
jgi:hypothetical protein